VAANQTWALDFVHDRLLDGRGFRALAVIDEWSRESLAIEVDVSLTGERVTRVLERLGGGRGLPALIQSDNGPEFTGRVLDQWAYERGVKLQFIVKFDDRKFRLECGPRPGRRPGLYARRWSWLRTFARPHRHVRICALLRQTGAMGDVPLNRSLEDD
jgi:transposase InsO family protein